MTNHLKDSVLIGGGIFISFYLYFLNNFTSGFWRSSTWSLLFFLIFIPCTAFSVSFFSYLIFSFLEKHKFERPGNISKKMWVILLIWFFLIAGIAWLVSLFSDFFKSKKK